MKPARGTALVLPDGGCRLPIGALRPPLSDLYRKVIGFRRLVEEAVAEHSKIGPLQASRIHTACIAQRQAARIDLILRAAGEPGPGQPLDHVTWLNYSRELLRCEECRDKALAALGLDKPARAKLIDTMEDEVWRHPPAPVGPTPAEPTAEPAAEHRPTEATPSDLGGSDGEVPPSAAPPEVAGVDPA